MDFFFTAPLLSEDHAHHPAVPALEPLLRFLKSPTGLTLYTNNDRTQRYHLAQARLKNAGFPLLCDQHAANRFQQATSYEAWLRSATELDELEGNDEWKSDLVSDDYDYKVIKMRLEQLRDAQLECEVAGMLFLIRTTFSRNIGNMGNINVCLMPSRPLHAHHLII